VTRSVWAWVRLLAGLGILVLLLWRVGTGPFLRGVQAVDGLALSAALLIGAVITVGCAWRWSLIAAGLGVRLPLRTAMAAYYRSQFLNTTTPGGIIGDVDRAARHGSDIGDIGLGVRAVVLDRVAGQVAQIAIAVVVLFAFPSPIRPYLPVVLVGLVAAALGVAALSRGATRFGSGRIGRVLRALGSDLRTGLFAGGNGVRVGLLSAVVVVGHLATLTIAARAAGVSAAMTVLLPLMLLVLLATAIPLNIAGWGPREGMAAWAFAVSGLPAASGVATSVTFGVLVLAASLPGLGVLLYTWVKQFSLDREVVPGGNR